MKYDLSSDIHVDINHSLGLINWPKMKNEASKALVVAGDIANSLELTKVTIRDAAEVYEHVIFVDGNHEHYSNVKNDRNVHDTMAELEEFANQITNVHYLRGTNFILIDDVAFVGACSWYDFHFIPEHSNTMLAIDTWKKYSNDFHKKTIGFGSWGNTVWPRNLAIEQATAMAKTVTLLQDDDRVNKIVIVTHTVPTSKGLIWTEHDPVWNELNGAYGNSQMQLVWDADTKNKIIHSVYGHTHMHFDFYDHDGIRFICNPRGYVGESMSRTLYWMPLLCDTNEERGKETSAFGDIER